MEKDFAKLFNIDGAQVLIYYDFDSDADTTTIHQITEVDGVRADMKIELDGPDQEERMTKYLSKLTECVRCFVPSNPNRYFILQSFAKSP